MTLRGERWLAVALSAAVFGAIYARLHDGPILLQHQGSQLVRAAHALTEGRGLWVSAGEPLARYGPLYAVLLAPLAAAGFSVGAAAYLVNGATFAASFPALAALGRELRLRSPVPLLGLWALWAPNVYLLRAVRPDPLPITLSLFASVALLRHAREGGRCGPWVVGLLCAAAGLARTMAVFTLVPVMAVGMWLASPADRRRRAADTGLVLALSLVPVLAWAGRNLALTGYPTGMSRSEPREVWGEVHTLLGNLGLLARTVVLDAFSYAGLGVRVWSGERPGVGTAVLGAALAAVAAGVALAAARRNGPGGAGGSAEERIRERRAARLCSGFAGFYAVVLVALWTVGNNDPINTRYAAPAYPFLIALGCWLLSRAREQPARWPGVAAACALVLVAVPNAVKSARLLGMDPGEQLIETRVWEDRPPTWRHAIDWDNVRRLRDPRDRVFAAGE